MTLHPDLLEILACPQDRGPLHYLVAEALLYNPRLRVAYEVREGIPVLLVDEALRLSSTEAKRLDGLVAALVGEQGGEQTAEPDERS